MSVEDLAQVENLEGDYGTVEGYMFLETYLESEGCQDLTQYFSSERFVLAPGDGREIFILDSEEEYSLTYCRTVEELLDNQESWRKDGLNLRPPQNRDSELRMEAPDVSEDAWIEGDNWMI